MTSGPPSIIVMMPPAHHQQQAQASHNSSCERARSTNNTSGTPLRDANGNNNDILTVVASSSGTASPVDPSTPSRSLMAHQRGLHESSVPCINNNIDNHHYHIQDNVPDLLTRSSYRNSLPHSPSSTNSLVRRTSFSSTTSSRRSSSELAMNNQTTTASAEIPPMLPRKEKSLHHQQTHSQSSSLLSSTPSSFPSTHHPISSSSSATVENSSSSTSTTSINNINNNNNNQATLINVRNSTCITARVKAQVMTRDDSTGGWLPVSGGGLSNVMLIKRSLLDNTIKNATSTSSGKVNTSRSHHHHRHHHHRQTSSSSNHNMSSATNTNNHQSISPVNASSHSSTEMPSTNHYDDSNSNSSLLHEYLIVGTRISDKNIVLYCNMKRDFVYNKAMPTFHHWMTGNTKFGLTFVSASEARSFDHSITTAIKDLLLNDAPSLNNHPLPENEDEDIFMTLELPVQGSSSSSAFSHKNNNVSPSSPPSSGLTSCTSIYHRQHKVNRSDEDGNEKRDPQRNSSSSSTSSSSPTSSASCDSQTTTSLSNKRNSVVASNQNGSSSTRNFYFVPNGNITADKKSRLRVTPRSIPPEMEDYRDKDAMMEDLKTLGLLDSPGSPVVNNKEIVHIVTNFDKNNKKSCSVSPSSSSYQRNNRSRSPQVFPEKGFTKSSSSPSVVGVSAAANNPSNNFMMMGFTNLMTIEPIDSANKDSSSFVVKKDIKKSSNTLKSNMNFLTNHNSQITTAQVQTPTILPTKRKVERPGVFSRVFSRLLNRSSVNNHHYKCNKKSMSRSASISAISNNKIIGVEQSSSSSNGHNEILQCRYCLEYYSPKKSKLGMRRRKICQAVNTMSDNLSYTSSKRSSSKKSNCRIQTDPASVTSSKSYQNFRRGSNGDNGRMKRVDDRSEPLRDCEYAPDRFLNCIQCLSCLCCVSGMMYHCIDKDEDDTGGSLTNDSLSPSLSRSSSRSSACSFQEDLNHEERKRKQEVHQQNMKRLMDKRRKKRCVLMTVLSFVIPCLWCYPCLKVCHSSVKNRSCCFGWESCGPFVDSCVGGKHEPLSSIPSSGISSQEPSA